MTDPTFTEWLWAVAGVCAFMALPFCAIFFVWYLTCLFSAFFGSKDDEL